MSSSISEYVGVWKRTSLYEPKGTLGPIEEQELNVLWIQSKSGYFIDIRIPPILNINKLKSFAGNATFIKETSLLTWNREIDFRFPGTPDVGIITFLSPNQIQEDNGLPDDDYREIWDKLNKKSLIEQKEIDFSAKLMHKGLNKLGYFIIIDDWFAFALGKINSNNNDNNNNDDDNNNNNNNNNNEIILSNKIIKDYFNNLINDNDLIIKIESYLMNYITIFGDINNSIIKHSLDYSLIGMNILSPTCPIYNILKELDWCIEEEDENNTNIPSTIKQFL
jgi:hypothetical protein